MKGGVFKVLRTRLMILLNVLDMDAIVENKSHLMHFLLLCRIYTKYNFENSHALEFALQPEVL